MKSSNARAMMRSITASQASTSRVRLPTLPVARALHTSPPLDPHDEASNASHVPFTTQAVDAAPFASAGEAVQEPSSHVYVPLSYLHPSTKPRASADERRAARQHVPLSSHVFGQEPRTDVMHSAVVYYLDGLRSGTANTKTRGEVNFSGAKIRPQKGTGQARVGRRSSPVLRKGGVIHGPKPRDFATDLPRRVRELALRSALSARWKEGKLHVVPNFFWDPPPHTTGPLSKLLGAKGWSDALFLSAPRNPQPAVPMGIRQRLGRPSALDPVYASEAVLRQHGVEVRNLITAMTNLQRADFLRLDLLTQEAHEDARKPEEKKKPGELHAYQVLERSHTVLDLGALEWLEEKLGGAIAHEDAEILALGSEGEGETVEEESAEFQESLLKGAQ